MKFKLIIAMLDGERTTTVLDAAREAGATGSTVINSARGEGLQPGKTFLGLSVVGRREMILMLVEAHRSRSILETVARAGRFEEEPGSGVAFQIDIEDALGLRHQAEAIKHEIEEGEL